MHFNKPRWYFEPPDAERHLRMPRYGDVRRVAGGAYLFGLVAACLSGAVCGDHCSPISDTTIMASAGAHCSHVNHVSTQLPYAMTAAAISAGCYLLCGAAQAVLGDAANTLTSFVLLACAIVIELVVLSIVRARMGHTGKEEVTKS